MLELGLGCGDFQDTYSFVIDPGVATPVTVVPGAPHWNTKKVKHTTQYYKIGSKTVGSGRIVKTHTLQFYIGCGRQE